MYVLYGCGNPRVLNLQKQPIWKYIIIREMKNCIIYYWTVGTRVKGSVKRMYD